jgi:DNA topoisomerase-1
MSRKLLIVESPAKAKTIEKILGKNFTVKSSYGHIRDLEKGNDSIDVAHDFAPKYVVSQDKLKVVKELKEWINKVDEVWLATDEDREGEAISWHLCEVLGLDVSQTPRIVFTEITKPAIERAVQNPRKVNVDLVNAQQARRVLDRLVGFELSELLWRKIKGKLSAGRVQSVAVKLIVEREREIQQFESRSFFKITALFPVKNQQGKIVDLKAELKREIPELNEARVFLEKCIPASYAIRSIEKKPAYRKPPAPFTTSTLQQEASKKYGFSVNRTMSAAQRLYEQGHITYMRTDSTSISEVALAAISDEIKKQFGDKYLHVRRFKTKQASAQEAHEAIRPTYIQNEAIDAGNDERKLYDLIRKRTLASQMEDAILERTIVDIGISTIANDALVAEGEVLQFEGFLKVYLESKEDDEGEETQGVLPPLTNGMILDLKEMRSEQRFSRPPSRYSEAGLVKKLEELGIGRPSTYAPTITKIMEEGRGYVVKDNRDGVERTFQVLTLANGTIKQEVNKEITGAVKNRLFPTDMGMIVTDFLNQHFDDVMDYSFTADIEKQFDDIAMGKLPWATMLKSFYFPFHANVEKIQETAARATGEREIGIHPPTGKTIIARISKFGNPILQIGKREELAEDEKPVFANLKQGQSIESISLEDALKNFELPRILGQMNGEEITVNSGRYGPYIKVGTLMVSLPKGADPLNIDFEEAMLLVQEKQQADAPIYTFEGHAVTKGTGRFGPFIKWNGIFINVPKRIPLDQITSDQIEELIQEKMKKESNRFIQQWPDDKISIENGRWGPYIRFGKKMIKIGKKPDGTKYDAESAASISLEQVKQMIEVELPGAFSKPKITKAPTKKTKPKKG